MESCVHLCQLNKSSALRISDCSVPQRPILVSHETNLNPYEVKNYGLSPSWHDCP